MKKEEKRWGLNKVYIQIVMKKKEKMRFGRRKDLKLFDDTKEKGRKIMGFT